jgi:hypothetical protein
MQTKNISPEVLAQLLSPEFAKRFWSNVKIGEPDECWFWTASKSNGYGQLWIHLTGKPFRFKSNRLAWIIHHKMDVPFGMWILHSCVATPNCCNPAHLRPGTPKQNVADMIQQGRAMFRKNLWDVKKGERHYKSQFHNDQILKIRRLYSENRMRQIDLATMFKTTKGEIWKIVHGFSWKHI